MDTSVWSLALRRKGPTDHPSVERLTDLLVSGEDVVLCGVVLQEILQAFRDEATVRRIVRYLRPFAILPADRTDHEAAARIHRDCAKRGLSVTTVDCWIAAVAIAHGCVLLSADRDFVGIARHCDLRLA